MQRRKNNIFCSQALVSENKKQSLANLLMLQAALKLRSDFRFFVLMLSPKTVHILHLHIHLNEKRWRKKNQVKKKYQKQSRI